MLTNPTETGDRGARRWRRRRALALIMTLAVSSLAMAPSGSVLAAQLAAPHPVFNNFLPSDIYIVEVNGVPSPEAQIMVAEQVPAVLIVAPEVGFAALLTPRTGMAQSLNSSSVMYLQDGTVALMGNVGLANEGRFQLVDRDVTFSVGTNAVVLKNKPFLLGLQDVAAMEANSAGYRERESAYEPYATTLDALRSFPSEVRVRVYFGSWCPFCSLFLPRMMKVDRELEGTNIHIEYYGLPQPATDDPITLEDGIDAVPTGIIYVGDEEVARIIGNMWDSPESALKVLLDPHR